MGGDSFWEEFQFLCEQLHAQLLPIVHGSCEGQSCTDALPGSFTVEIPPLTGHNITIISGGTRFHSLAISVLSNHEDFAKAQGYTYTWRRGHNAGSFQ
eukprot:gene7923-7338_t